MVLPMHILSPTWRSVQFVTDYAIEACQTRKLLRLYIASTDNYNTEIVFGWTNCNGSSFVLILDEQIAIIDNLSP